MGKLGCPCGHTLSNTGCPNDIEGLIFNLYQEDMDIDSGRDVWECKECGRLAVSYPTINDCKVKWYIPENGEPGDIL